MKEFKSIWGEGEEITLQAIDSLKIGGKWLNLAAGDGRYVKQLVDRVDLLTLADIKLDETKAFLSHLSKKQRSKIKVVFADLKQVLPFNDREFDGVFCTGTLHLFSEEEIRYIFTEIDRILKPKGKLIVDFATEITREFTDDRFDSGKEALNYSTEKAKWMLTNLLKNYDFSLQISTFTDDVSDLKGYGYKSVGEFILAVATKK